MTKEQELKLDFVYNNIVTLMNDHSARKRNNMKIKNNLHSPLEIECVLKAHYLPVFEYDGANEAKDFEKSAFVVSLEEFRKLEKELNDLKKELDNSKFGSQCIIHELEYDKKTLIKENEKLTNLLNEVIGLADLMSDEINKNWCKESKLAVGKLNLIIEKSGWIRP